VKRDEIGIVVIGRNEGERLQRCLNSLGNESAHVVYVDSGSTDGSLSVAAACGVEVVQLDSSTPFSAGRARNAGFKFLCERLCGPEYVQFIDGDCELCAGWIEYAVSYLGVHLQCAVVAGRVKEKFPEKTIYNQLCDIEWNTPVGEAEACGGIFMVRHKAFEEIKGFNQSIIAGEEPELCYRLRQKSWKIYRLDHNMVYHDAAIHKFSQWWKRAIRSGHAYAQGVALYGAEKENFRIKDSARIWGWALIFPAVALSLSIWVSPWWSLLFMIYALQWLRVSKSINRNLQNWRLSFLYSFFNIISKWPQLYGQLFFITNRLSGKNHMIIEYK
jgi:GT2 family glycosyltransferase